MTYFVDENGDTVEGVTIEEYQELANQLGKAEARIDELEKQLRGGDD